jgi:outer membrane protein assembly factor BamE
MLKNKQSSRIAVYLLAAMLLASCISVYKTDVQQGNLVTQEMVEKLKVGMNRNQVRFVLGTPLLTDPFHSNRWDYYYFLKKGGDPAAQIRRVTVFFEKDQLISVEGDIKADGLNETTESEPREIGQGEDPKSDVNLNGMPYPSSS